MSSTLGPAAPPEPTSCFHQIGSWISSLIKSIFSLLSSLWGWLIGTPSQSAGQIRTAEGPAGALVALGRTFFNARVLEHIPADYPRQLALIITIDGQRVAAYTQTLQETPPGSPDPRSEFFNQSIEGLQRILSQRPALTPNSIVVLDVMDFKRRAEDAPLGRYSLFTTHFSAAHGEISYHHGPDRMDVNWVPGFCAQAFSGRSPNEAGLHRAVLRFFNNTPQASAGWTYAELAGVEN